MNNDWLNDNACWKTQEAVGGPAVEDCVMGTDGPG